jgi:hypothetical protein
MSHPSAETMTTNAARSTAVPKSAKPATICLKSARNDFLTIQLIGPEFHCTLSDTEVSMLPPGQGAAMTVA